MVRDLGRKYMESWEGVIVNYPIIKFSVALVKEIERAVTYMSLAKPSGRQKKKENRIFAVLEGSTFWDVKQEC